MKYAVVELIRRQAINKPQSTITVLPDQDHDREQVQKRVRRDCQCLFSGERRIIPISLKKRGRIVPLHKKPNHFNMRVYDG
jgi:hypothetical protein